MLSNEKSLAEAIPADQVLNPSESVKDFLQEGGDLITTCERDRPELESVNIDTSKIERLEAAVEVLRDAQSEWMEDKNDSEEAREEWKIVYPEAEKLKKELLKTMRFVYEGDENALARVSEITEGNNYRDTIQDLHDIAYKAKLDLSGFEKINYDVSLFDKADAYSNSLMLLLSRMNGEDREDSDTKLVRDKAYTNLKMLVDYIRRYGKYVFRDNPERAAAYTSQYH